MSTVITPFSLKDAPALIERLLPVQKLSAEAYKEQMANVLDVVDLLYGQQVVYYGKTVNKQEVLADKRRFMQRWPERRYAVRPLTLKKTCDATRVCAVSGIVDWSAANPATAAQARGSAEFYYRVLWSEQGAGVIIHEESKVLDRQTQVGAKSR